MTTLIDDWPEPEPAEVAQRLRMYMGDKKLTRKGLALQSGIARSSLATKLDGEVEFTLSEIMRVAHAIGKSWLWVLTGKEPSHPDGGGGEPAPRPHPSPVGRPRRTRGKSTSGLRIRSAARPAAFAA